MLKEELIEKITKYFKLNDFEAEKIFDDIFHTLMEGVKENKTVDLQNFGEFIIKNNDRQKSVQFLAKQSLDDELNRNLSSIPPTEEMPATEEKDTGSVESAPDGQSVPDNIEEELRRKREAILSKLTAPIQDSSKINNVPVPVNGSEKDVSSVDSQQDKHEEIPESGTSESVEDKSSEIEDESAKSFSDYFSAVRTVSGETKPEKDEAPEPEPEPEPEERVIPPGAVDLHKEIIGSGAQQDRAEEDKTGQVFAQPDTNGKAYYIWYKDSEPSPQETQTLSVEYEMLYQAQKEAEYRSKLKIYVSTFILFFSFVLILLIFSPLIYKVFFTPADIQTSEVIEEGAAVKDLSRQQIVINETSPQFIGPPIKEQRTPPPVKEPVTPPRKDITQPPPQSTLEGLNKNTLGWTDDKYKVIYIILPNNNYTIQESAWDSESKALKRIKSVESLKITGLAGTIVKVELPDKGVWYRVRLGDFGTLEEARRKAIELRDNEKKKLHAMLLCFLFLT